MKLLVLFIVSAWCGYVSCQIGVNTDFANPAASMVDSRNSPHGFNHPVSHDIQNPRRRLYQDTRAAGEQVLDMEVTRFNGRFTFAAGAGGQHQRTFTHP